MSIQLNLFHRSILRGKTEFREAQSAYSHTCTRTNLLLSFPFIKQKHYTTTDLVPPRRGRAAARRNDENDVMFHREDRRHDDHDGALPVTASAL